MVIAVKGSLPDFQQVNPTAVLANPQPQPPDGRLLLFSAGVVVNDVDGSVGQFGPDGVDIDRAVNGEPPVAGRGGPRVAVVVTEDDLQATGATVVFPDGARWKNLI